MVHILHLGVLIKLHIYGMLLMVVILITTVTITILLMPFHGLLIVHVLFLEALIRPLRSGRPHNSFVNNSHFRGGTMSKHPAHSNKKISIIVVLFSLMFILAACGSING